MFIEKSDRRLLEIIAESGSASVNELVESLGVTATAVRQRLDRLVASGAVERVEVRPAASRGRPSHKYLLSEAAKETLGHNMVDLARALWTEIREFPDEQVRQRLVSGAMRRLAEIFRLQVDGNDSRDRIESLVECLRAKDVLVSVEQTAGNELPVLKVNGCPYPGLAGEHHDICEMEQAMFSELLGKPVRLTECKCHSAEGNCTFVIEASVADTAKSESTAVGSR
ncbi:MAG: MarR family transcriptional regulator [Pirellulaceae bacterium]